MKRTYCWFTLSLVLVSCRTAPAPNATNIGGFPSKLAKPATIVSPDARSSASSSARPRPVNTPSTGGTRAPAPRAAFTVRGSASDPRGDAGAKAPAYADLTRVAIESDGSTARITVTMGGPIPAAMGSEEEEAVGVDFFRSSSQAESDYQLYATGDASGWFVYLDTPSGFAQYPGSFEIDGPRLVFVVPWSALGGMRTGYVSLFMDWDRKGTVLNDVGGDHLPDKGKARYR